MPTISTPISNKMALLSGIALFLSLWSSLLNAFGLQTTQVSSNVYALVGEIDARSAENHGLNNTLGFVVLPDGVVLIGSGTSMQSAQLIEQEIAKVTAKRVRWVINVSVQDHHWLGNSYFMEKGAQVVALQQTVADQRRNVAAQLQRLHAQVGAEADAITPAYASMVVEQESFRFSLGGEVMELLWQGGGHFYGDAMLWLPQQQLLFSGDLIFHDRMLGVTANSDLRGWQRSLQKISELQPKMVIPGHGFPAEYNKSKADTIDYIEWLYNNVAIAVDGWQELDQTIAQLATPSQFQHLLFFDSWHKTNISQAFVQLEQSRQ